MSITAQNEYNEQLRLFRVADSNLMHIVYTYYHKRFVDYAFLKGYCPNGDTAEACDAFASAVTELRYKVIQETNFELKCNLETFIHRAAECNLIDRIRHNSRFVELEDAMAKASNEISPDESVDRMILCEYITSLLDKLTSTDRQIIRLFCYDGYDWKSIGQMMNLGERYLSKRKCLILARLKKIIEKEKPWLLKYFSDCE